MAGRPSGTASSTAIVNQCRKVGKGGHYPGSNTDGIYRRKGAPVPMKDRRKRGRRHVEQDRYQQPAQLRTNRQGRPGYFKPS